MILRSRLRGAATALLFSLVALACGQTGDNPAAPAVPGAAAVAAPSGTGGAIDGASANAPPSPVPATPPRLTQQAPVTPEGPVLATVRPSWLGTRELPRRADGFGEVQPTPPELADRRFPPPLGVPTVADVFMGAITAVPADVAARSTWSAPCPVTLDELRYVTVTHWGLDGRSHPGELMVNAAVADDVLAIFSKIYAARFPIEEVRITRPDELDLPPTGDGNVTSAFVCRPVTGGTTWSQHAYGLAVDINPFHNPYAKRDIVVPELASAYLDRGAVRPGMIAAGDAPTAAFANAGWGWGGNWRSAKDWMHFSRSGR